MNSLRRAVFLDRDGVINRKAPEGDYITRWDDFEFLPGVDRAIAQLNQAGVEVIVITNQRCIAKGLISIAALEQLHRRMVDSLTQRGARIDAIYYCPHEMEPVCRCRKPAPGMFIDAAQDRGIDLQKSWMVGDSEIDIAAGKNAGCKTGLIVDEGSNNAVAEIVADSLRDAVEQILEFEKASAPAALRASSVAGL
jgi:D-glycero-D-manno-heptose 1,7-bisphosphate phosphatase